MEYTKNDLVCQRNNGYISIVKKETFINKMQASKIDFVKRKY